MNDSGYPWLVIRDGAGNVLEQDPCPDNVAAARIRLKNAVELRRKKNFKVERVAESRFRTVSPDGKVEVISLERVRP